MPAKAKPKKSAAVSKSDEAFLRKKAANSRFTYGQLKKVLNRGKGGARKADADLIRGKKTKKSEKK